MKEPVLLSNEQKAEMVALYTSGMSVKDCAQKFNVHRWTVHRWLNDAGVSIRPMKDEKRIYHCDELAFNRSTSESLYWFGFLLADGCIYQRNGSSANLSVALSEKDACHLEKLKQFLKADQPLKYQTRTKSVRLDIRSDILCQSLITRGCTPAKSLTLIYPQSGYFYRRHFIRGYFDGDGCIHVNEANCGFPSVSFVGTHAFLTSLQEILVTEAGMCENAIQNHPTSPAKYLVYGGRGNAFKLYTYLYSEGGSFLERKKATFEYALSYHSRK
jgi:hypothetical protein